MKLEVSVARHLQWVTRSKDEVQEGDRVMQSDKHPSLVERQEVVEEPSVTHINYPDEAWDHDHRTHNEIMASLGRPARSKRRHLVVSLRNIMDDHAPEGSITQVRVVPDDARDDGERQALEGYLNAQFVEEPE